MHDVSPKGSELADNGEHFFELGLLMNSLENWMLRLSLTIAEPMVNASIL